MTACDLGSMLFASDIFNRKIETLCAERTLLWGAK